jgi:hypothetical protein
MYLGEVFPFVSKNIIVREILIIPRVCRADHAACRGGMTPRVQGNSHGTGVFELP